METRELIRNLAYDLYKLDWERRISANRKMDLLKEAYAQMADPCVSEHDKDTVIEDYLLEQGYGGELYVCQEEFLETEYRDQEYMKHLLGDGFWWEQYQNDIEDREELLPTDLDCKTIDELGKSEEYPYSEAQLEKIVASVVDAAGWQVTKESQDKLLKQLDACGIDRDMMIHYGFPVSKLHSELTEENIAYLNGLGYSYTDQQIQKINRAMKNACFVLLTKTDGGIKAHPMTYQELKEEFGEETALQAVEKSARWIQHTVSLGHNVSLRCDFRFVDKDL